MAGKPEPPQNHIQHHQQQQQQQQQPPQQQPNVQNVVVYVSNDNFAAQAYATAVNQQNVAASYPQPQNGNTAVTFTSSTQSVAPLVAKNLKPPIIKTQDFQPSNGLIGNVSLPQQASFYASTNAPGGIVQTNGFHHSHGSNVINNVTYGNSGVSHLNQGFGNATSVKTVCPGSIELPSAVIGNTNEQLCNGYSVVPAQAQTLVQQQQQQPQQQRVAQTFFPGPDQKNNEPVTSTATNFITQGAETANIVAVMGGEAGTTPSSGTVVFPRCDSVRSETAESSCSSLSSADSQPDANAVTLVLPPGHHNAVMLNNGIQQPAAQATGIVRTPSGAISLSQQQLGNIVLAMTVPPNSNNVIQPSNQPVPVQPVVPTITVPYGWKRLNINGNIVYIR